MTCPACGADVQPHDRYCLQCGHALQAAEPTGRLDAQAAPPGSPSYGSAASAGPPSTVPAAVPVRPLARRVDPQASRWASGSTTPPPNPYQPTFNQPSSGTMLNGRPLQDTGQNGLMKGLGAAVIALVAILHQFGHAIAGLGPLLFKVFLYLSLFRWLPHMGLGGIVLLIVVLMIGGAIWRSQTG